MLAKIFQPTKTAMQSGKAKQGRWVLKFEREQARSIDPLMGYTTSTDMRSQVTLEFPSLEAAKGFAEEHGIAYSVQMPKIAKRRKISYAENFAFDRAMPWTH